MTELDKTASSDFIRNAIYVIRGVKVMLDADLAEIYGYTTKAFNQQVKNNIGKFDDVLGSNLQKMSITNFLGQKKLTSKFDINDSIPNNYNDNNVSRSKNLTLEIGLQQGEFSKYLPYVCGARLHRPQHAT